MQTYGKLKAKSLSIKNLCNILSACYMMVEHHRQIIGKNFIFFFLFFVNPYFFLIVSCNVREILREISFAVLGKKTYVFCVSFFFHLFSSRTCYCIRAERFSSFFPLLNPMCWFFSTLFYDE